MKTMHLGSSSVWRPLLSRIETTIRQKDFLTLS